MCVALLQVRCYCLQCLQNLERTVLETRLVIPQYFTLMMDSALNLSQNRLFFSSIYHYSEFLLYKESVSFLQLLSMYKSSSVESGADTGRIHCIVLAVT